MKSHFSNDDFIRKNHKKILRLQHGVLETYV